MNKWSKYAGWAILVIIALIFIQAGLLKLFGAQVMVEVFHKLGFPDWFRNAVGICEIAGSIALMLRNTLRYGAMILAVIMIGAITSALVQGQTGDVGLPLFLFCILVWIAVIRNRKDQHKKRKATITS